MSKWTCDFCQQEQKNGEPTEIRLDFDVTLEFDWVKTHRSDLWKKLKSIERHERYLRCRYAFVQKEKTKDKYAQLLEESDKQWDDLWMHIHALSPNLNSALYLICRRCLKKLMVGGNLPVSDEMREILFA